jgi:hypothetical protein
VARPRNETPPRENQSLPPGDDAEPGFDEPVEEDADESESDAGIIPA